MKIMSFDRVVKSILNGALAMYSGQQNGHSVDPQRQSQQPDGARVRVYECVKRDAFLSTLSLEEWTHRESIVVKRGKIEVTDFMEWPQVCTAERTYSLYNQQGELARQSGAWTVKYNASLPVRTVVGAAMRRRLEDQDESVFNKFVQTLS